MGCPGDVRRRGAPRSVAVIGCGATAGRTPSRSSPRVSLPRDGRMGRWLETPTAASRERRRGVGPGAARVARTAPAARGRAGLGPLRNDHVGPITSRSTHKEHCPRIERGGKGRNEERRSAYPAGWPPIREGGLSRPGARSPRAVPLRWLPDYWRGLRAVNTTTSVSLVGSSSVRSPRMSMSEKPARSSISCSSFVK